MEKVKNPLHYQSGFGNEFASEAKEGALPQRQNSPQKVPHGLYAEQLSGTAFTVSRSQNKRTWFYRTRPSVLHKPFKPKDRKLIKSTPFNEVQATPNQLRWDPLPIPKEPTDFVDGLITIAGNGGLHEQTGCAVHLYAINKSMDGCYLYNADGDFLIVPQEGKLLIQTEFGLIDIAPGEIAVIQRGMKFQVKLLEKKARGYICENYGAHFRLPDLGPIGANGLASPRDFLTPTAHYEEQKGSFELVTKFQGGLWSAEIEHSPFDVVAWHGNYVPYKYNLKYFQAINTVTFDHCDPSIFTVLTSPSSSEGVANVDFVIFPERWMVAEHTFRPPYYHRNFMSEYMGIIYGVYDAKEEGFKPGGGSLHNSMSAHGPDSATYKKAIKEKLKPHYLRNTLSFMFESRHVFCPTSWALKTKLLQKDYYKCWQI